MPKRIIILIGACVILILALNREWRAQASPNPAPIAGSNTIYLPFVANNPPVVPNSPTLGGCAIFPSDSIFNKRIDTLFVHPKSSTYIDFIGASTGLHPDFGANWNGGPFGIPYIIVPSTQPHVPITFDYASESDPSPYPIPPNAPIEGGADSDGDRHVLVLQQDTCLLYEMYYSFPQNGGASWTAGSGAKWNLGSNALRPAGWTSADAAGLPILPLLVRYDEVAAGEIKHAIRFTIHATNMNYIWPAHHLTPLPTGSNVPPLGQRFRLKSTVDISRFSRDTQVILTAFKRYGIIIADNGSDWYISGAPDARWNDSALVTEFRQIHGSDFEAVDESGLMIDSNSAQSK